MKLRRNTLGVFTGFSLVGFGMASKARRERTKGWAYRNIVNLLSGIVSACIIVIFAVVKFTEGAWVVLAITPILVYALNRLNRRYRLEQTALKVDAINTRAVTIARHEVTVLVDIVDLATIGAVRYARSVNPRSVSAVHFVLDDQHAEEIKKAWMLNPALADVAIEFIDCPDRRLPNAALDYAIRATTSPDVELTLLLPRRSYSSFVGRLMHDRTAEAIADPISQLPRVVATIIPFDVERIITGGQITVHEEHGTDLTEEIPAKSQTRRLDDEPITLEETSHYAENIHPIAAAQWRHRAHVTGHVTNIRNAPANSTPHVDIEIWDETGGITLQFIGRREITGLEVGSILCAEGMVGETDGNLVILNPSYEIIINHQ